MSKKQKYNDFEHTEYLYTSPPATVGDGGRTDIVLNAKTVVPGP